MRIALITDGIWPYVLGGMQKHSYYLCKYLAQQQVNIDLVHFNNSEYDISRLEIFTDEEKKYIHPIIVNFPKSAHFPGHYIYNSYRHSRLVYEAIKDNLPHYDFIYAKGFTGWYLINQKFTKKISCPPIGIKFHGYEMFQKPPNFKVLLQHIFLLRWPVRSLSRKADVVFSYGGKVTEIIRSLGIANDKIVELPSGVERSTLMESITPVSGVIKFLFLGRYERRKGIEELNTAIKSLLHAGPDKRYDFQFVGPIPENKRLKYEQVVYHGEIRSKEKLQELLRTCDILICPSWSEGMPNVILEAMASGMAVIATDVGATNVLVNNSTGWLLKASDAKEIENIITSIVNAPSQNIDQKKQNALTLIKTDFLWEKLITKLYATFLNRIG
jgi:glycosyltransferase involved in cell wall biosynthesis